MARLTFSALLIGCVCFSSLHAHFLLDDVMSPSAQKQTGVNKLSFQQKVALEEWLNQNFDLKTPEEMKKIAQRYLSINVDQGQKILLNDNTLWQVNPSDVNISASWLTPVPIDIKPGTNPMYPSVLINKTSGTMVNAKQVSNVSPAP